MFLSHSLLFTKRFCFIHFSPRKVFVSLTFVHDKILFHLLFISLHKIFVFHSLLFTKGFSFMHSDVFVSFSPLHEMFLFHLLFFSKRFVSFTFPHKMFSLSMEPPILAIVSVTTIIQELIFIWITLISVFHNSICIWTWSPPTLPTGCGTFHTMFPTSAPCASTVCCTTASDQLQKLRRSWCHLCHCRAQSCLSKCPAPIFSRHITFRIFPLIYL